MSETRTTKKLCTAWIQEPRPTGRPQLTTRSGYAKTVANILAPKGSSIYDEGKLSDWVNKAKSSEWGSTVETSLGLSAGTYRKKRRD